jgi:hypothetical protein
MRISLWGLILCLGLMAPVGVAQAASRSSQPDGKPDNVRAEAWQIFLLANQARAAAGISPLAWNQSLAVAAQKHCVRMSLEGQTAHRYKGEPDLSSRAGEAGAHFSFIAENLAVGSAPGDIHKQWMDAFDNRAGLLNPDMDSVGVAVVELHGMLYAVADYVHLVPVLTQVQVEAAIAGLLRSHGLAIVQNTADARALCAGRTMVSVQPSFVMIWQNSDLTQLPDDLVKILPQAHFRKAAVGNCPALDDGDFSQYRVAVLLYSVGVGVY